MYIVSNLFLYFTADKNNSVVSGHLNEAYISATAEIVLNIIETNVDRIKDPNTELNIFKF